MTTPPPLPQAPVTATYQSSDGTPLAGTVTFTPSAVVAYPAGGVVVPARPVVVTLDASGHIAVDLVPTEHADLRPQRFEYRVTEEVGTAQEVTDGTVQPRSYVLRVPAEGIDLSRAQP